MTSTSTEELADAWLTASRSGNWAETETFSRLLFEECNRRTPQQRGIMTGAENEIVQEACLILFGTFLLGNEHLREATTAGNLAEIGRHLKASIHTCVRFATQRIAGARARELSRRIDEADERHFGSVDHPRHRATENFSIDERCAMALAALQLALEQRLLSAKAAEIARLTLEDGLTGREISQRLGISPSAVSQQLKKVTAQLSVLKNAVEVSLE